MTKRELGGLGLERDPEGAERSDVVRARREHEAADLRPDHDQALRLQLAHRLAHRRAADAEGIRHHLLGDGGAKRELAVDDSLAQPQHHPLRQRFRRIELERSHLLSQITLPGLSR
ncbi:hypothetical protein ACVWXQ_006914 [Bradyrhizobium sp. S3.14.4]